MLHSVTRCYDVLHSADIVLQGVTQCYTVVYGVTRC